MTLTLRPNPHRSNDPTNYYDLTTREIETLEEITESSRFHYSGGSYNMIAMFTKNSIREYGYNRLDRMASTVSDIYPDISGMHAELDLYRKIKFRFGGTVFIAGTRQNGSQMFNSRPCMYCATILDLCKVRWAVYYDDGIPTKAKISELA